MSTATDGEAYAAQAALHREIRERVADDIHDLIVESERMGSQGELVKRIRQVGYVCQQVVEARGRQMQARETGLPLAASIRDEREARELLRATVMGLAAECGGWVIAMDFETRKSELPFAARPRSSEDDGGVDGG